MLSSVSPPEESVNQGRALGAPDTADIAARLKITTEKSQALSLVHANILQCCSP